MIEMGEQYLQELFSFRVEHKKLTNTGAGLFQMEPTQAGAEVLNSYGLYFKSKENGFVVVAPCIQHDDHGLLELKNQFTGGGKLSFAVFTTDKTFFDWSDLPYDPPGEYVYYFNNLDQNQRRTRLLLNQCGIKASERVQLHTKQFSGTIAKNAQGEIVFPSIFDCRGNTVQATRYDWEVNEYQNTYTLDLARLVDGLYTIEYHGEQSTYYCTKASFIRRIPLLILEIFIDPDLPEEYRVVQWENGLQYINFKKFILHFGLDEYYWRYKMIPINIPPSTWLTLQTDPSEYRFVPDRIRINEYQAQVLFTSGQKIDIPNDDRFTIKLYRLIWNDLCRLSSDKYQFCLQDYGKESDDALGCREMGEEQCIHQCPACCTANELIGLLPKPGGESTEYYTEDEEPIAQLTFYLVYDNGEYIITEDYDPPVSGDFTHCVIEDGDDVTIQFINKVDMSYVILHYEVTGKISRQDMTMNKIGNIYQMEKIVQRFYPQLKLEKGDQIVYWFTYELIDKQVYTSEKFTHIFNSTSLSLRY